MMESKYEEIRFDGYTDIERAVAILQEYNNRGELVYGTFNGHILYSDKITMDGAYFEIFGQSKADFERARQECLEDLEQKRAEYERSLPELTNEWIAKGREVLAEEHWNKWEKCVLSRVNLLYENLPDQCLEVVSALNAGCSLAEAKAILEQQGHSGASLAIVLDMIKQFSHRGSELANIF